MTYMLSQLLFTWFDTGCQQQHTCLLVTAAILRVVASDPASQYQYKLFAASSMQRLWEALPCCTGVGPQDSLGTHIHLTHTSCNTVTVIVWGGGIAGVRVGRGGAGCCFIFLAACVCVLASCKGATFSTCQCRYLGCGRLHASVSHTSVSQFWQCWRGVGGWGRWVKGGGQVGGSDSRCNVHTSLQVACGAGAHTYAQENIYQHPARPLCQHSVQFCRCEGVLGPDASLSKLGHALPSLPLQFGSPCGVAALLLVSWVPEVPPSHVCGSVCSCLSPLTEVMLACPTWTICGLLKPLTLTAAATC
jgi:hypothetical protein